MKEEYHANKTCEITSPSSVSLTSSARFCFVASSQSDIVSACFLPRILWRPLCLLLLFIFLLYFNVSPIPSLLSDIILYQPVVSYISQSFVPLFVLFSLLLNRAGRRNNLFLSLLEGISLILSLFQSPFFPLAFGCPPANFNTHHGMLGIVQQMPLRRTFLSGTTPLFTLFIHKYLSPALIPACNPDHCSLWK